MNEIKHALRQLALQRGLSVTVILMLAVGIGATTAMFSLFHEVLLRPLPVPAPERLVNLAAPGPKPGSTSCMESGPCEWVFSYPMFRDLEAGQTVFTGLAAHRGFDANLARWPLTRAGDGLLVSGRYFEVLELRPALGRLLAPEDDRAIGESPVVVLSHEYWLNQFGGDRNVVGDTLMVNGRPLTIVGVAPEGFSGTTVGLRPDVFVPLTLRWLMAPTVPRTQAEDRQSYWLYLFGRLRPGVSMEQAGVSLNGLYRGIVNDVEAPLNGSLSGAALEQFRRKQITLAPGGRGQSELPSLAARPMLLLLGVTALVLLIACLNVANLLLAHGASRAGEMAVRASIGAGRGRLLSQCLAEALALAAVGGALSVPVAAATLHLMLAMAPGQAEMRGELSGAALAFAAAATLGTVLLFGIVPALRAARTDPGVVMKGASRQSAGRRGDARFRAALSTAQIAFSTVLLVLAGLFAQSLANVGRVDLGMSVQSVVTFTVSPRLNGYSPERVMALYDELETRLAAQPGVTGVASSSTPLLANSNWRSRVVLEGEVRRPGDEGVASTNQVSVDFFRTLGMPLLAGRGFVAADDLAAPRVAVVNEAFVRLLGLTSGAVGRRFGYDESESDRFEIVGVVADAKYSSVKDDVPPQLFLPRRQNDNLGTLSFYVRGMLDQNALLGLARRVVAEVDPQLPVSQLVTMERQVEENVHFDRLVTLLSAGFAALATALAAVGLYGVLAYVVTERTRELGLRLALGAEPRDLRAMVLKQVGFMSVVGGTLGLAAALALGRLAEALLFGLSPHEPLVLLAAVAVLAAVVLGAGYLPARRASAVAPMEALRYE